MTALHWLQGIDWPTIVAFFVIEVAVVLCLAPFVIQRRNEARAVAVFTEKLLPLMPAAPSVEDLVEAIRGILPAAPTPEDQVAARDELATAIGQHVQAVVPDAVQLAVGTAVKGRMGALSALGVEGKQSAQAMEWAFRQAIAQKGGWKASLAILGLKVAEPKLIKEGAELFALSPDGFDAWWDEHGSKFLGSSSATKAKQTNGLMRV